MDTQYAAVWDKGTGPAWQARHGLSEAQFEQEMADLESHGYWPVEVSGYSVDNNDTYAAIWEQRRPHAAAAEQGKPAAEYQRIFDQNVAEGLRLLDVCGYTVAGEDHYISTWMQIPGPDWVARHGLSADEYQQEFDTLVGQGYRLARIRGWPSGDIAHYAAIWVQMPGPDWVARHGLSADEYQQEFDTLVGQGYRLTHVSGY